MSKISCRIPYHALVAACFLFSAIPLWCHDKGSGLSAAASSVLPFDSKAGNPGSVIINKKVEHITLSDVRKALSLPDLDKGNRLFTAKEIGLREGDTPAIGMLNAAVLRGIPKDCPGIQLDKMYYVYIPTGKSKDVRSQYIVLDHDFVLDGEVDGKAVGGLKTNQRLFYTEHSLNLRKTHIVVEKSGLYYAFYINTRSGIDQLQVKGCVFEGQGSRYGKTFLLSSEDETPLLPNGLPSSSNYINHILFDGNSHQGKGLVGSGGVRIVKSCRLTGNTIYDISGVGIALSTDNSKKYAVLKTYMSCPIFIVGNTFRGMDRVVKKRTKWTVYYCAALIESSRLYMLHNTIRDFVSGQSLYTTSKGEEIDGRCATYDLYANVTQLYYCNNHVTNLLQFAKSRPTFGIFKAKGCGVPGVFAHGHLPVTRYYLNNVYDTDKESALRMWRNRTYPQDGGNYSKEKEYDRALTPEECLTLKLQSYVAKIPMDTLCIRNNTFRAQNIGGMIDSSHLWCTHFICEGNTFDAKNITSKEYNSIHPNEKKTPNREWLFAIRGAGDSPTISITGNRFTTQNQSIRLMLYKYNEGQVSHAKRTTIKGNVLAPSSSIVLKSLNSSKWRFSTYPAP